MSNLKLPNVSTYAEAAQHLNGRVSKQIGYKTRLVAEADSIAVYHHSTAIVRYFPDGSIALTCGGWHSPTTSNRLHHLTPAHVRVNLSKGSIYVTDTTDTDVERRLLNGPVVVRA